MLFPHAMNALECMTGHGQDPTLWVWMTWGLTLGVVMSYTGIAVKWWISFGHDRISLALIAIFILCMVCGYLTFLASIWIPDYAYTMRFYLLILLNVSNIWFFVLSRGKRFETSGRDQRVGREFRQAAEAGDDDRIAELQAKLANLKTGFDDLSKKI